MKPRGILFQRRGETVVFNIKFWAGWRAAAMGLCVVACTPAPQTPASGPAAGGGADALPADCALVLTKPVAFTGPGAQDVLEARALPSKNCDHTVLALTLRAPDGRVLYAFAAPLSQASQGGAASLRATLQRWVNAVVDDTSAAPAWTSEDFPTLFGANGGTPFIRQVYERIRAERRPRLCHETSYDSFACIYFEVESGQAGLLFNGGL
jgi:hypothetical protein